MLAEEKELLEQEQGRLLAAVACAEKMADMTQHRLVEEKKRTEEMGKELMAVKAERARWEYEKAADVRRGLFQLTVCSDPESHFRLKCAQHPYCSTPFRASCRSLHALLLRPKSFFPECCLEI